MIALGSYTYIQLQSSKNQAYSPQALYGDFFTKLKNQDKAGVKKLSWSKLNTPKEFDYFYQNISKYNFDSAEYTIKLDSSYYFDITKVKLGGESKNIKLYYIKIDSQNADFKRYSYYMEYSDQGSYELM